jgi:hypothetical protein
MTNSPDRPTSPVTRRAALDAHGMERRTVGRVLEGKEREKAIADFLAWLEHRDKTRKDVDTDDAPIAKFLADRRNSRWTWIG